MAVAWRLFGVVLMAGTLGLVANRIITMFGANPEKTSVNSIQYTQNNEAGDTC